MTWEKTGICPQCSTRGVTCSQCRNCGWEAPEEKQDEQSVPLGFNDLSDIPGSIDDILSRY